MFAVELMNPLTIGESAVIGVGACSWLVRRRRHHAHRPGPERSAREHLDVVSMELDRKHHAVRPIENVPKVTTDDQRERYHTQLRASTEQLAPGLLEHPVDERHAGRFTAILEAYVDRVAPDSAGARPVGDDR